MSDYQVIKLSNGENLICDVISDSDTTLNVKSPLMIFKNLLYPWVKNRLE